MKKTSLPPTFGILLIFVLVACASPTLPGEGIITPIAPVPTAIQEEKSPNYRFGVPLTWDKNFVHPDCTIDKDSSLFDEALSIAGLDKKKFGFGRIDLLNSPYYATEILQRGHPLPWHEKLLENPAYAGCFEGEIIGSIKYHYQETQTPVANIIRDAAVLLGSDPKSFQVPTQIANKDFDKTLETLCDITGGCGEASGDMPPELKAAITPILSAIGKAVQIKKEADENLSGPHDARWWHEYGGNFLIPSESDEIPNLQNNQDRDYIVDKSGARKEIYKAAANIAQAVESVNWQEFVGLMGIEFDLYTEAGWIQIRDGADHEYADDGKDILLRIDLGGNDFHLDPVATNTSYKNTVAIDIDLSGEDTRTYEQYTTPYDKEGLLPSDNHSRFPGDGRFGSISLSRNCRQGAGINATAMLFDFGEGDDHYQSLRCSQGYTHGGVGTVFDGGGKNIFLCEMACQASSQFGISVRLIKGQGKNLSSSFSHSQGFGYVQGIGIDISGTGDDVNICNPGDPAYGGVPLYYTPQLPGKGNTSFCQGAGFGRRSEDIGNPKLFLAGGMGIKLDLGGSNTFVASVSSQGVGQWQGVGILDVQGEGNNKFDALWYGQGASAHFGVGMFFRSGTGEDIFNGDLKPVAMMLGAGHDFGPGIFINDTGNAEFHIPLLSAGAANCNGLGLFVINAGGNKFISDSTITSAISNVKCACATIPEEQRAQVADGSIDWCVPTSIDTKSASIMIIVGNNTYQYPEGNNFATPHNLGTWTHKQNDSDKEYSAGINRVEGETGIHVESNKDE